MVFLHVNASFMYYVELFGYLINKFIVLPVKLKNIVLQGIVLQSTRTQISPHLFIMSFLSIKNLALSYRNRDFTFLATTQ